MIPEEIKDEYPRSSKMKSDFEKMEESENRIEEEPLMSYDGPKFFADSRKQYGKKSNFNEDGNHDIYDLLNYYRTRCAEFDRERKEYIDRFNSIEVVLY